jgi:3-oxoadipate CoA-transferase beta subunit
MVPLTRAGIAWRAAQDLEDGMYVNLGVGLPTLVADHIPSDREIMCQSENGILGIGPAPTNGDEDADLINASERPITLAPGASFFSHGDAFMMIRGGHLDVAMLGAFEVSIDGDVANWKTDRPEATPAVGGAMDLAVGARAVWVLMHHCTKDHRPRIVEKCRYPLTGRRVVKRIFTDLAVIAVERSGLSVLEKVPGLSMDELQCKTGAQLSLNGDWRELQVMNRTPVEGCRASR